MAQPTLEKAVANPTRKFNCPEEVLHEASLKPMEKLAILRSWEDEAHQLQTAENENMGGGEPTKLYDIRKAIDRLCKEENLTGQDGC